MTNTRPKVLLIIPNLGSGGAQRVFHQHRVLLANEFEVVACTFNFDGAFEHEKNLGIISLDVPGGKNPIDKAFRFFERVRKLKQLKVEHKINVSISHLEGADYVNILSKGNEKVVLWIHGTKFHDQNIKGFTGWLRKSVFIPRWYSRADRIVCVSNGIADELRTRSGLDAGKIEVVHNGIDINSHRKDLDVNDQEDWHGVKWGKSFIVTHCRLAEQKNLTALIDIINRLKNLDFRWLIVGDGEQREQLLERCRKYDLKTYDAWSGMPLTKDYRVYFAGHQINPFELLEHSAFYISTSKWEGFPLSLVEALACKLTIIASDCFTGPREILAPELNEPVVKPTYGSFGVLMPVPDDEASIEVWAHEIRKLMVDNDSLTKYSSIAERRVTKFSEKAFLNNSIAVIRSVIK